jgi:hypothetical protein
MHLGYLSNSVELTAETFLTVHTVDTYAFYASRRGEQESQHSDHLLFLLMRTERGNILGVCCSFESEDVGSENLVTLQNEGPVRIQFECLIWNLNLSKTKQEIDYRD